MRIKFTVFNNGQEYYEFDKKKLKKGEKLEKFLINKDEFGKIYIVPMICYKENMWYPTDVLEPVKSKERSKIKKLT